MGIRRRLDLDRLLDRRVGGEEPEATGDLALLLHAARAARAAITRFPSPDAMTAHLSLLREDRARGVIVTPSIATRRIGRRLAVASLVTAVILALGASSAVALAEGAIPGDATYGLKRSIERISLALHRDPVGRAAAHLRIADRRLAEIDKLHALGRDTSGAEVDYARAVAAGEQDVVHAQALGLDDDALLDHVMEMLAKHVMRLLEVKANVPEQAQDAIQRAVDNAQKAQDHVQQGRGGQPHERPTPPGHGGQPPGRK